jgi:hypothetical protein
VRSGPPRHQYENAWRRSRGGLSGPICQPVKRENDLESRVARGEYVIDTHRVAEAMLRKRGRGLLVLVPGEVDPSPRGGPKDDPGPGLSAA